MIERVHGIDRHKRFSTISVLDRQGEEVRFEGAWREFRIIKDSWNKTDKHDARNLRRHCGCTWSPGSSGFPRSTSQAGGAGASEAVCAVLPAESPDRHSANCSFASWIFHRPEDGESPKQRAL